MFLVADKICHNTSVVEMKIKAPDIAKKAKAGQFVILRASEDGERIPLTIAAAHPACGTVSIIFQIAGATTLQLSQKQAGDYIPDFAGPLGRPTEFGDAGKICVIGGGVGCAIALPQAAAAYRAGTTVDVIAGFRSKDIVILERELASVCHKLHVMTDDGSYGEKGFVTDKLRSLIECGSKYDLVIAIGPVIMMKMVSQLTKEYGVRTIVSLNPIMVDGTGMCGCCRVTVGGQVRFACVDGPDFDGHLVDYDELMSRNRFYREQEQADFEHQCKIGLRGCK